LNVLGAARLSEELFAEASPATSYIMTSKESLALNLIFGSMGESPFNRTIDEYLAIAARAPKLAVLHADINRALGNMAAAGHAPYEICYFKAGDKKIWSEKFPTSLSIETVRQAWIKVRHARTADMAKAATALRQKSLIFWACFLLLEAEKNWAN
jgi:hypothetical protein